MNTVVDATYLNELERLAASVILIADLIRPVPVDINGLGDKELVVRYPVLSYEDWQLAQLAISSLRLVHGVPTENRKGMEFVRNITGQQYIKDYMEE